MHRREARARDARNRHSDKRRWTTNVVSPLDPDWSPDGGVESTPFSATPPVTPMAPAPDLTVPGAASSSYPPAPMAPAPMSPAPMAPAPAMAAPLPSPALPSPPVAPAVPPASEPPAEAPAEATLTDVAPPEANYGRSALEEESDFEAGLLTELLLEVLDKSASDLHLTAGARPTLRLNGQLEQLEDR